MKDLELRFLETFVENIISAHLKEQCNQAVVVLALILELDRQRGRQVSKFKASRAYRTSSKTAKTTQRNPVSGKKKVQQFMRQGKGYAFT